MQRIKSPPHPRQLILEKEKVEALLHSPERRNYLGREFT